ncbi:MAG: hypothetical protein HYS39_00700, partial [Proteobacteria bacterium]|nr:hypothetical protein [Pseudomonadota bacterium]
PAEAEFGKMSDESLLDKVYDFILTRLDIVLRSQHIDVDCVKSVIEGSKHLSLLKYNLWSLSKRAEALQHFLQTPAGEALLTAYRRSYGIIKAEEKKDHVTYLPLESFDHIDKEIDKEDEVLLKSLFKLKKQVSTLLEQHAYSELMEKLADLRETIDNYFNTVTINTEDKTLRQNRLRLLATFVSFVNTIADLSFIEGEKLTSP